MSNELTERQKRNLRKKIQENPHLAAQFLLETNFALDLPEEELSQFYPQDNHDGDTRSGIQVTQFTSPLVSGDIGVVVVPSENSSFPSVTFRDYSGSLRMRRINSALKILILAIYLDKKCGEFEPSDE